MMPVHAAPKGFGLTCSFLHGMLQPADGGKGEGKVSKKQLKQLRRLKIAELKQKCERPDVVEVWDVTSPDPQMLVFLKVRHAGGRGQRPAGYMQT